MKTENGDQRTPGIEVGWIGMLCLSTMNNIDPKEPVNREMLDEAIEAILKGVERMFAAQERRFDNLEEGQRELQHQINDLKLDTPTQKEFEEVKAKVDKYHPLT